MCWTQSLSENAGDGDLGASPEGFLLGRAAFCGPTEEGRRGSRGPGSLQEPRREPSLPCLIPMSCLWPPVTPSSKCSAVFPTGSPSLLANTLGSCSEHPFLDHSSLFPPSSKLGNLSFFPSHGQMPPILHGPTLPYPTSPHPWTKAIFLSS